MNDNSNRKNVKKIQRIHLKMVLVFMLMILVAVVIIARITVKITDRALKNEAVSLTTSLNVQMKLNVESYISRRVG
jgi:mannose/fructose/N-acetylgalactosamine-specific phosphotransferase system component IIC